MVLLFIYPCQLTKTILILLICVLSYSLRTVIVLLPLHMLSHMLVCLVSGQTLNTPTPMQATIRHQALPGRRWVGWFGWLCTPQHTTRNPTARTTCVFTTVGVFGVTGLYSILHNNIVIINMSFLCTKHINVIVIRLILLMYQRRQYNNIVIN